MTLTADQLETFEKSMRSERKRILSAVESLHESSSVSMSDETEENGLETHIGENATATYLRERDLSIEEHEEQILSDIDAALDRVKQGTFGRCLGCGEQIATDRLEALPWAERCIDCQKNNGQ